MPEELRLEEGEREGETEPDGQGVMLRDVYGLVEEEACREGLAEALGERDSEGVSEPPSCATGGAPVAVAPSSRLAEGEREGEEVTLGEEEWVPLPRALGLALPLPDSEPQALGEGLAEALSEPPPGEPLPEALKEGEELGLPEVEGEWEEETEAEGEGVRGGERLGVGELEGCAVALGQLEGEREEWGEKVPSGEAEKLGKGVEEGELDRLSVAVEAGVGEGEAAPVALRVPAATLPEPRAVAELVAVEQRLAVSVLDWDGEGVAVARAVAEGQRLAGGEAEVDGLMLPEPEEEGDSESEGEPDGKGDRVELPMGEGDVDAEAEAVSACSARGWWDTAPAASAAAPLCGAAAGAAGPTIATPLKEAAAQLCRSVRQAENSWLVGAGASRGGAALCAAAMGALRVGVGAEARACSARSKGGCSAAGAGSSAGWPDRADGVGSMSRNAVVAFMARSAAGAAARAGACRHTHCAQSSSPTRSLIAQKKLGMAQAEIDEVKYMAKSR